MDDPRARPDDDDSGPTPLRFATDEGEGSPPEEGMLEKIREILVGQEKREIQRRFRILEERMLSVLEEHQRSTARRFEKLESRFQRDVEALEAQHRSELGAVEAKLRGERDERTQAVEELRGLCESLLTNLEREKNEIDRNKLDRFTLSEVLVETAMRLSRREEVAEDGE